MSDATVLQQEIAIEQQHVDRVYARLAALRTDASRAEKEGYQLAGVGTYGALVGDRDRLTPPPCAESIAGALAGTELTVLEGAGHMLMMERPAEVSAALLAVVERAAKSMPSRSGRRAPAQRNGYDRAA